MKLLKDLFLDELADIYDAEQRIVKALPKLAQGATCTKLNAAFLAHLQETKGHVTKLEQVAKSIVASGAIAPATSASMLDSESSELSPGSLHPPGWVVTNVPEY